MLRKYSADKYSFLATADRFYCEVASCGIHENVAVIQYFTVHNIL